MSRWFRSSSIQLSDDEDYQDSAFSIRGCMASCFPRSIRLEDATLDDYLDPNTTTTIEPLLDEFNTNFAALNNAHHFLSRNPFASTTLNSVAPSVDLLMENDDAECLSDHRISAVMDTKPDKELCVLDDDRNPAPTLAFHQQDTSLPTHNDSSAHESELTLTPTEQNASFPTDSDSNTHETKLTSTPTEQNASLSIDNDSNTHETKLTSTPTEQNVSLSTDNNAHETELTLTPTEQDANLPTDDTHQLPAVKSELTIQTLPMDTTLTASSEPSSPIPAVFDTTSSKFPLTGLPRPGSTSLTMDNTMGKRQPSVASVAHSILGDKLDDFTEKLSYIRNNIISSLEDEDNRSPQRSRSSSMLHQRQMTVPLGRSRSASALDISSDSDFSKVIAMGKKNVRHMKEDLMANGIRFFNDFSTKMKNASVERSSTQRQQPANEAVLNNAFI